MLALAACGNGNGAPSCGIIRWEGRVAEAGEANRDEPMISSIILNGYRGFERFEMSNLARLNLLVGTNNIGKTSVLDAIFLLISAGDPAALWHLLWGRGERLTPISVPADRPGGRLPPIELDVSHLFNGHEAQPGSSIKITAKNDTQTRSIEYAIAEISPKAQAEIFGQEDEGSLATRLVLELKGSSSVFCLGLRSRSIAVRHPGLFVRHAPNSLAGRLV